MADENNKNQTVDLKSARRTFFAENKGLLIALLIGIIAVAAGIYAMTSTTSSDQYKGFLRKAEEKTVELQTTEVKVERSAVTVEESEEIADPTSTAAPSDSAETGETSKTGDADSPDNTASDTSDTTDTTNSTTTSDTSASGTSSNSTTAPGTPTDTTDTANPAETLTTTTTTESDFDIPLPIATD